jgi:hypothetical protein
MKLGLGNGRGPNYPCAAACLMSKTLSTCLCKQQRFAVSLGENNVPPNHIPFCVADHRHTVAGRVRVPSGIDQLQQFWSIDWSSRTMECL